MDPIMASKIRVGMSTNIYLLQFKIQGHLQKWGLWMLVYQMSFPRKKSKTCTISVTFCSFPHQNSLTCHYEYFGVYFSWQNHQMCFKMIYSSPNNAKSRVYQSQACFLQPNWASLIVDRVTAYFTACFTARQNKWSEQKITWQCVCTTRACAL